MSAKDESEEKSQDENWISAKEHLDDSDNKQPAVSHQENEEENPELEETHEDDCGWDESETLAERIRKLGEEEKDRRHTESPREGTPTSSTTSKHEETGDTGSGDRGNWKSEATSEAQEQEPQRQNIWKELEKMQSRARGGGMPRGVRAPIAPRFCKSPDQFQDNRRGSFGGGFSGPRFGDSRGRSSGDRYGHRGGGGRNRDDDFSGAAYDRNTAMTSSDTFDRPPITKGFGGDNRPSSAYHHQEPMQESRIQRESPAYRSLQVTLRGAGAGGAGIRGRTVQQPGSSRDNRGGHRDFGGSGRSPARKGYLDRQHDDDDDHHRKTDHRYSKARNSRQDYYDDGATAREKNKDSYWTADSEEPAAVAGYGQQQLRRSSSNRDSPIFEPIRKAMENLDHSNRSMKQIMMTMVSVADDYCKDDSDRWLKLIEQCVMSFAVDQGGPHVEFACSLFGRFIDRAVFQKAAYISLMRYISNLMAPHEWTDKDHRETQNLCDLFGRLLIFVWPPGWDSCAKECNMIVYAIMNAVQTWLRALDKAATRDAPVREDLAEVSAICLWHVATATGRKLWLKWPDLIDQMYATLRMAIISRSCPLQEDTKSKLLDLYIKLNEWPKPVSQLPPKHIPKRDSYTQTDRLLESPPAAVHHSWLPQQSAFEPVAPSYVGLQEQNQGHQATLPSMYSVPPPTLPFTTQPQQASYGTTAMLQSQQLQQQQKLASFRGAAQQPRMYIGPMGKQ